MSDDPINALVSELLAEADLLSFEGKIRIPLDSGFTLIHNPCGRVMIDVVSYADVAAKNYCLSAGQYFDVKTDHAKLTQADFSDEISRRKESLKRLFIGCFCAGMVVVEITPASSTRSSCR